MALVRRIATSTPPGGFLFPISYCTQLATPLLKLRESRETAII